MTKIHFRKLPLSLNPSAPNAVSLVLYFALITLIITSLSRISLSIIYLDRIASVNDWLALIAGGARVDIVLITYVYSIPLFLSIWLSNNWISHIIYRLLKIWLVASLSLIVFMELITPEFILEYDMRPNRLFIDYLIYPREVFSMLWTGYKGVLFSTFAGLSIVFVIANRFAWRSQNISAGHSFIKRTILFIVLVPALFLVARSSLQHRSFNPSMVFFSSDNLVNSLILNSSYSVLFDLYNLKAEKNAQDLYGSMAEKEIIRNVRESTSTNIAEFVSDTAPTLAYHPATNEGSRKNIVIILEESLGARYVGGLDGLPLTPNLDKLLKEGWNLANLYATGTRSIRGIEAIITGFPPSPSRSVIKLGKSQTDFFTLASFLKQKGYFTQFIYGGESHFDNMKSFFLGNGFLDIKDLPTFDNPKFVGSWGASDEDLFNQADIELTKLNRRKQPFFSLIFSSSNHSPYVFPEGCTSLYNAPENTRENAIKYADCALGKFISKARNADYWKNTIFLVISDHDSRVYGSSLVPIDYFRIPAVVFGESISPRLDLRLTSQLDIPPTLLSLAGVDGFHPMIGHDLTREIDPGKLRAMMQYASNFAWMDNEEVIIFRPDLPPQAYTVDEGKLGQLLPEIDSRKLAKAKANALWASLAYQKGYYAPSNMNNNARVVKKSSTSFGQSYRRISKMISDPIF